MMAGLTTGLQLGATESADSFTTNPGVDEPSLFAGLLAPQRPIEALHSVGVEARADSSAPTEPASPSAADPFSWMAMWQAAAAPASSSGGIEVRAVEGEVQRPVQPALPALTSGSPETPDAGAEAAVDRRLSVELRRDLVRAPDTPLTPTMVAGLAEQSSDANDVNEAGARVPSSNGSPQWFADGPSLRSAVNVAQSPLVTLPLRVPVGQAAWSDDFTAQISSLVQRGEQLAVLRVVPEHLGPIEVRIEMEDSTAKLWFGAPQAETRAAIESAVSRLRELFSHSGLTLGGFNVASHTPRDPSPRERGERSEMRSSVGPVAASTVSSVSISRQGLVDYYV